ncbi:MAG: hypothetical protein J6575_02225 [Bifidobacterium sp.]|nr:hypothetical protein [Bifidobacterium sp.]
MARLASLTGLAIIVFSDIGILFGIRLLSIDRDKPVLWDFFIWHGDVKHSITNLCCSVSQRTIRAKTGLSWILLCQKRMYLLTIFLIHFGEEQ